jgi:transcription elongation factor GreA-like protein
MDMPSCVAPAFGLGKDWNSSLTARLLIKYWEKFEKEEKSAKAFRKILEKRI